MTFLQDTVYGCQKSRSRKQTLICDRVAVCGAPTCPHKEPHAWCADCDRQTCQRDQRVLPVECVPVKEGDHDRT